MYDDYSDETQPSKSQRKREAHALRDFGESLVKLNKSTLAQIPLPEELYEAVIKAQHLHQRGALKRQLQYIGKLMRQLDVTPIREAYEQATHSYREDVEHHHRLEKWRDRLLAEGDQALGDLLSHHASVDRQHIRQLVRRARKEAETNKPSRSARELFRYLREIIRNE